MKYWIALFFAALVVFIACHEEDDIVPASVQIEQYLTDNAITGEETSSTGLVYLIEEPGGSVKPTLSDSIRIFYKGYITDGTVFDQTTDTTRTFLLDDLILAWEEGIPLIGRGGKIKLISPPSLAYGNSSRGNVIKEGSVLVFDIELVDIK